MENKEKNYCGWALFFGITNFIIWGIIIVTIITSIYYVTRKIWPNTEDTTTFHSIHDTGGDYDISLGNHAAQNLTNENCDISLGSNSGQDIGDQNLRLTLFTSTSSPMSIGEFVEIYNAFDFNNLNIDIKTAEKFCLGSSTLN